MRHRTLIYKGIVLCFGAPVLTHNLSCAQFTGATFYIQGWGGCYFLFVGARYYIGPDKNSPFFYTHVAHLLLLRQWYTLKGYEIHIKKHH